MEAASTSGGSSETRRVKVGDREYTIGTFYGKKTVLVMREVAALLEAVPDLSDRLSAFEREHTVYLSREEAEAQFGAERVKEDLGDEFWEGGRKLALKPGTTATVAALYPMLFRLAEGPLIRLLALVALDDVEIRKADEERGESGIDDLIRARERDLLYGGPLEQLTELAVAGYEVGRSCFAPLEEMVTGSMAQMGAALALLNGGAPAASSPSGQDSSETSPSSSTDSPSPTGGAETTSSTESPTASSELSPVG